MTIPTKAVEAGAIALHEFTGSGTWAHLIGHRKDALRAQVLEVLDAAAVHMVSGE